MVAAAQPTFEPGRVYRTRELGQWSANAPRLAQRLVRDGQLVQLAHGLFAAPRRSRFGEVPPTDEALLRAFLDGEPFVFTGPERWNALGLGTTAVFATPARLQHQALGPLYLRWSAVPAASCGLPRDAVARVVRRGPLRERRAGCGRAGGPAGRARGCTRAGKFDRDRLASMSTRYGSRRTQALVKAALGASAR